MSQAKIVLVGAASVSFGINTIFNILKSQQLKDSKLLLVDKDVKTLNTILDFAVALNDEWGGNFSIECHNEIPAAGIKPQKEHPLADADFVICALEVQPREELWKSDFLIPLKYGVRQPYAENSGPGGFAHALRNIPQVMNIVKAMEQVCPEALFINFTNPMIRICDAINRYSCIKVVGLCHQYRMGYAMVGKTLADVLSINIPPQFNTTKATPGLTEIKKRIAHETMKHVKLTAAGINHFTWMLELIDRKTGKNLYPTFTSKWSEVEKEFEPLTSALFSMFNYFPISGDEHLAEYLPWMSDPQTQPWLKFDISLYEWDLWNEARFINHAKLKDFQSNFNDLIELQHDNSEGAVEVIEGLWCNNEFHAPAINIPNNGYISNLPQGAVVEIPATISGGGIEPEYIGAMPEPIAELCRRELTTSQLCVDSAVSGDKKLALQALLLDPVIRDIDIAKEILNEYINTYEESLPQFNHQNPSQPYTF